MSQDPENSLPELQSLADALGDLAQADWVESLAQVDEQLSNVHAAEQALSTLQERVAEVAQAVEDLKSERESATQAVQGLAHDLQAESEGWQQSVKESDDSQQEASAEFRRKLAELVRQGNERLDGMRSTAAEQLPNDHQGQVRDSLAAVADGVRNAHARADGTGADLVSKAQQALQQLDHRLKDELASKIEQQASQRFASEAGRLGGEVANNLVLSQASLAITGAVTPILPQLVALKAAVGAIKFALNPFG